MNDWNNCFFPPLSDLFALIDAFVFVRSKESSKIQWMKTNLKQKLVAFDKLTQTNCPRGVTQRCNNDSLHWPSVSAPASASGSDSKLNTNAVISVTQQQEVGCPLGAARDWRWINGCNGDRLLSLLSAEAWCLSGPERTPGTGGLCKGPQWPRWFQSGLGRAEWLGQWVHVNYSR